MVCPHGYRRRHDQPRPRLERPVQLVVFDMDGVLIDNGSSWVLVHRHFGVENQGGYERYMAGEIDDHAFIRTDVALWTRNGPVHESVIDNALATPDFMRGAKETVKALHDAGVHTAIVSGGLDYMANRVAKALGIDQVFANGLRVDATGHLTGEGILRTPLADKGLVLRDLAEHFRVKPGQVAAIGDSCPDTGMFERIGLAIAFNPADPCVAHAADVTVHGRDLAKVLPHLMQAA